jgi:tetratricopeptide (TPR) repeat protein
LLYERGQVSEAIDSFERALASDPSFADAHFNLAMALHESGLVARAREHWEAYLKLDPESQWAEIARRHLRTHA